MLWPDVWLPSLLGVLSISEFSCTVFAFEVEALEVFFCDRISWYYV